MHLSSHLMGAKQRKIASNMPQTDASSSDMLPHTEPDDTNDKQKRSLSTTGLINRLQCLLSAFTSTSLTLTSMAVILVSPLVQGDKLQPIFLQAAFGYLFLFQPLLSTLSICLESTSKSLHERVIAGSFLTAILSNQFPKWTSCAVASCAVVAFGLASRQFTQKSICSSAAVTTHLHKEREQQTNNTTSLLMRKWATLSLKERAALATLAVVISLLLENFLIWVVSATYAPGIYENPTPLQDNGRLVLERLAVTLFNVKNGKLARRKLQFIRDVLNVQWAIVSGLGASFICLELQIGNAIGDNGRSLAGLALHALMTLASARLIRTISFVLTVLPSQIPYCYRQHFPMPPSDWGEWLLVGFLPNSRGGCNDLILSGHATVITTLGCGCTSVANNYKFSMAVWTLVMVDFAIESYQGLHYSVDMWLGCIVTALLWQLTKGLEVSGQLEKSKRVDTGSGTILEKSLDRQVISMYAFPAFLGFIILTFVSESVVNYFLVGYAIWAGLIMFKWGFTNFSQHVLLCLLFVTLGSYL